MDNEDQEAVEIQDNILKSIKILLGIQEDYDAFDNEIIYNINSAFMSLYQIGFGSSPFSIKNKNEVWSDAIENDEFFESVKMYIFQKTKLGFDPPTSSFVLDSIKNQLQELEWRLNIQKEEFEPNSEKYE